MKIFNRHEIGIAAGEADIGRLIDTLASANDLLWPRFRWPRMRFDRPLSVGARGGHGPIGYSDEEYETGKRILFRFENTHRISLGLEGHHRLFMERGTDCTLLVHEITGTIRGRALAIWPLIIRPLHDALIGDALAQAAKHFDASRPFPPWLSPWVRVLRFALMRGRGRKARHLETAA